VFVVTVNFTIDAAHLDDFLAAVQTQAANSLNLERQCLQFDVAQSDKDPCEVFLYEIYSDSAAFDAHLKSAHFAGFNTLVTPWVKDKSISTWVRL